MIHSNTCWFIGAPEHPHVVRYRAVFEFVGSPGGGEQLAVDSDLSRTVGTARAEPQVVIAGAVDLGFETDSVERYERSLVKVYRLVYATKGDWCLR